MAEEDDSDGVQMLTKPRASSVRRWTCFLCTRTCDTDDLGNCKTRGRLPWHIPERHKQRLTTEREAASRMLMKIYISSLRSNEGNDSNGVQVLTNPPAPSVRMRTCFLCEQKFNTEDFRNCKTCGRPLEHSPERYEQRLTTEREAASRMLRKTYISSLKSNGIVQKNDLATYLLRRSQGKYHDCPEGFTIHYHNGAHAWVLLHLATGIQVLQKPLQPTAITENLILLYHYTNEVAFNAIALSKSLWATLEVNADANRVAKDICFGDGVYMTALGPEDFGTREAVLINNFTNATDQCSQQRHILPHKEQAEYCIPVLVPPWAATDVMTNATPVMTHGPGRTKHGDLVRSGRNIWVVALRDDQGSISHVKESPEMLLERLQGSGDAGARRLAGVAIADVTDRGNAQVKEVLAHCLLHETDNGVRLALVQSLRRLATPADSHIFEVFQTCVRKDSDAGVRSLAQRGSIEFFEDEDLFEPPIDLFDSLSTPNSLTVSCGTPGSLSIWSTLNNSYSHLSPMLPSLTEVSSDDDAKSDAVSPPPQYFSKWPAC